MGQAYHYDGQLCEAGVHRRVSPSFEEVLPWDFECGPACQQCNPPTPGGTAMEHRLMKFAFIPKAREDFLIDMVKGTKVLDVGYAGGTALHLLVGIPVGVVKVEIKAGKPEPATERETRSFRRFDLGDVVPTEYTYIGHARVGTEWVFVFERNKSDG